MKNGHAHQDMAVFSISEGCGWGTTALGACRGMQRQGTDVLLTALSARHSTKICQSLGASPGILQ